MTFGPAAIMAEMLPAPDASSTANSASTARSRCSLDRLDSHPFNALLKVTELLATSSTLSNSPPCICQENAKCCMMPSTSDLTTMHRSGVSSTMPTTDESGTILTMRSLTLAYSKLFTTDSGNPGPSSE